MLNVDGAGTVVIVDDEPSVVDLTAEVLSRELPAYRLVTETTPRSALEHLEADGRSVECIVSDYQMPETDGLELLRTVRETHPALPFVLYTGRGSEEIASRAIEAGVTGYIQKGGADQLRRLAHRVEQAIDRYRARRTVDQYARVLTELDYPVYVSDREGRLAFVNRSFAELTGYDRETLIGSHPSLIKTEASVETAESEVRALLSDDGPTSTRFEVRITPGEGDPIPCRDHMAVLTRDGEYRGAIGIVRDLSTVRASRRRAERHRQRLEQVLAILSHDLRTPLQRAHGAAALIESDDHQRELEQLTDALSRLERLLEDVLTLVRQGEPVDQATDADIGRIARRRWECVGTDAGDLLVEDPPTVTAEPQRLRSLVENLLSNAVRHGGDAVTVRVGATDDGGWYVEDDGPGVPPPRRDEVFEPGYTTAEAGTGFGLSIVKQVADSHGWSLCVTDGTDGGARFEFRLGRNEPADG